MIKLFAIAALFLGFVAIESFNPETGTLLSDTGAWTFDTGSDDTGSEDTGSEDTGSEDTEAQDTGSPSDPTDTGTLPDTGNADDTASPTDTGSQSDTGSGSGNTVKYSAAQLANESGGCSTGGSLNGPWALALLLGFVRRRRN